MGHPPSTVGALCDPARGDRTRGALPGTILWRGVPSLQDEGAALGVAAQLPRTPLLGGWVDKGSPRLGRWRPVRLLTHFTTRKVRCVTPAPSITRVLSSSIGSVPRWSNNLTPSPSRTGTRSTCISSRSPTLMHCCAILAAPTATFLSAATALACSTALSTPSVTNVNGDPS